MGGLTRILFSLLGDAAEGEARDAPLQGYQGQRPWLVGIELIEFDSVGVAKWSAAGGRIEILQRNVVHDGHDAFSPTPYDGHLGPDPGSLLRRQCQQSHQFVGAIEVLSDRVRNVVALLDVIDVENGP